MSAIAESPDHTVSGSSNGEQTLNHDSTHGQYGQEQEEQLVQVPKDNSKAFLAGVASGVAKLSVGHPFDTIKVRLQTSTSTRFSGPWDCLVQTVRKEGARGLYKGASPPLVGWMAMDSIMLGSLNFYRKLLAQNVFTARSVGAAKTVTAGTSAHGVSGLPIFGHGCAGILSGWTVSFVAAPIEHVKARLQIQYAADKSKRLYSGPVGCVKQIYGQHGIRGLYKGLGATLLFRTFFFCWWGSYELFTRVLKERTSLSAPMINFWAGGLSAQVFWVTSYPSDVVKQQIMTDGLGKDRKYPRWRDAAVAVKREAGWKGYWRGFTPCFLRAFPANAVALVAFEAVMRSLD